MAIIRYGAASDRVTLASCAPRFYAGHMNATGRALTHPCPPPMRCDLAWLMRSEIPGETIEYLLVAGFDVHARLLCTEVLGTGGWCSVEIDMRRLFALLATDGLAGIILAHNHPSGDPTPSQGDIALTAQIARIARMARIDLVDHIVFGGGNHRSFRALSLL